MCGCFAKHCQSPGTGAASPAPPGMLSGARHIHSIACACIHAPLLPFLLCPSRARLRGVIKEHILAPLHPGSSRGSEPTCVEGIHLKVYASLVVYIKPNLFRSSSSDMLAEALRACLSGRLLGRSLPLIAMSLSLLDTKEGRRDWDCISRSKLHTTWS